MTNLRAALARFNSGIALARAAYDTEQRTDEDRKAARRKYERRRYDERKKEA